MQANVISVFVHQSKQSIAVALLAFLAALEKAHISPRQVRDAAELNAHVQDEHIHHSNGLSLWVHVCGTCA